MKEKIDSGYFNSEIEEKQKSGDYASSEAIADAIATRCEKERENNATGNRTNVAGDPTGAGEATRG